MDTGQRNSSSCLIPSIPSHPLIPHHHHHHPPPTMSQPPSFPPGLQTLGIDPKLIAIFLQLPSLVEQARSGSMGAGPAMHVSLGRGSVASTCGFASERKRAKRAFISEREKRALISSASESEHSYHSRAKRTLISSDSEASIHCSLSSRALASTSSLSVAKNIVSCLRALGLGRWVAK
jgi:hypothetical protein